MNSQIHGTFYIVDSRKEGGKGKEKGKKKGKKGGKKKKEWS